jgi:hypothetical protein
MIGVIALAASLAIHGDFDRDGRGDSARAVHSRNGYRIVIDRADRKHQTVYEGTFSDLFLAINRYRGWVRTACGKGYDVACTDRSPNRIFLRGGELIFGQKESSSFVVVYRQAHFVVVQLSD